MVICGHVVDLYKRYFVVLYWNIASEQPTNPSTPAIISNTMSNQAHYSPPWADVSIIGVAGSSGSGKSTLSHAIVSRLNLPWVVILSMVKLFNLQSSHFIEPLPRTPSIKLWMKKHPVKLLEMSMTLILPMRLTLMFW